MNAYRVTKYNLENRDLSGRYIKDEWTSVSDVGHIYDSVFTVDEYQLVENKYIYMIESFINIIGGKDIYVRSAEKPLNMSDILNIERKYDFNDKFSNEVYQKLDNMQQLTLSELLKAARMVLREYMWCEFVIDKKSFIRFGYDYYMYFYSLHDCLHELENAKCDGMFVEQISYYGHTT